MTDLERILAMEEIKAVKARYYRYIDTHQFEKLTEVLTDDSILDLSVSNSVHGKLPLVGIEAIVKFISERVSNSPSLHLAFAPEIVITSDTTAKAVWGLEIFVREKYVPGVQHSHGYGHVHDTYLRATRGWSIQSQKLVPTFTM